MMKKNGWGATLRRKQYVIAGALVVVAAIGTTVYYSNTQEQERQQMEAELAQEMNQQTPEPQEVAVEEGTEEAAEASAVIPPKTPETTETAETAEVEKESGAKKATEKNVTQVQPEAETEQDDSTDTAADAEVLHFAPEDGMNWPMEGNVILNYSMDATTYFPTLDQYKCNPAIIISGDVNSKVYSVARGKVSKIENDPVTGCTMTVELGDGYEAVYGQLKELNFEVGDYVEAGHVLGYVSEPTKYFSVEGSNLYFELRKDETPVDPVDYFES